MNSTRAIAAFSNDLKSACGHKARRGISLLTKSAIAGAVLAASPLVGKGVTMTLTYDPNDIMVNGVGATLTGPASAPTLVVLPGATISFGVDVDVTNNPNSTLAYHGVYDSVAGAHHYTQPQNLGICEFGFGFNTSSQSVAPFDPNDDGSVVVNADFSAVSGGGSFDSNNNITIGSVSGGNLGATLNSATTAGAAALSYGAGTAAELFNTLLIDAGVSGSAVITPTGITDSNFVYFEYNSGGTSTSSRPIYKNVNMTATDTLVPLAPLTILVPGPPIWSNASGDSTWTNGNNWNRGGGVTGIPGTLDTATFSLPAGGVVSLGGTPQTVQGVALTVPGFTIGSTAGDGTLNLSAITYNGAAGTTVIHSNIAGSNPVAINDNPTGNDFLTLDGQTTLTNSTSTALQLMDTVGSFQHIVNIGSATSGNGVIGGVSIYMAGSSASSVSLNGAWTIGGTAQVAGSTTAGPGANSVTLTFPGGGSTVSIGGNLSVSQGAGGIVIAAGSSVGVTGNLIVAGSASSFVTINQPLTSLGGIQVSNGSLNVNVANPFPSSSTPIYLGNPSGGAAAVLNLGSAVTNLANPITVQGTNSSTIQTSGGGAVTLAAPITLQGNVALNDAGAPLNINGQITGNGNITTAGTGTVTLAVSNTFAGGTTVSAGTLAVASDASLGAAGNPVTVNNSSKLQFNGSTTTGRTFNLGNCSLVIATAATLNTSGATFNGGYLRGPGTLAVTGSTTFNGMTTLVGSNIVVNYPTTFSNFTSAGSIIANTPITWDGGSQQGTLTVNAPINVDSLISSGVITINSGGTLTNSQTNLVAGGGSRTTINNGGVLALTGSGTMELNGGVVVNNGSMSGVLDVNYGSLAEGAGTFGTVNVTNGGAFHPGNSPGTATSSAASWGAGGKFELDMTDATGSPGSAWSFWQINGLLNITAGSTPNSQFVIELDSLNSSDSSAPAADFNPMVPQSWIFADAGSLEGFSASDFSVNTTGFLNPLDGGSFSVTTSGNNIELNFTPVPEPTSLALLGLGTIGLLGRRRSTRCAAFGS